MRTTLVVLISFVLTVPLGSAESAKTLVVDFAPPGQLVGDITADNGEWVALFFDDLGDSTLDITTESFSLTNHSFANFEAHIEPALGRTSVLLSESTIEEFAGGPVSLHFGGQRAGSLLVQAKDISVAGLATSASLLQFSRPEDIRAAAPADTFGSDPFWDYAALPSGNGTLAVTGQSEGFTLNITDATAIQWYGAEAGCSKHPCPSGGGRTPRALEGETGVVDYSYLRAEGLHARITGTGVFRHAVLASKRLDVSVLGEVRLPGFRSGQSCSECARFEGSTFAGTGELRLSQLAAKPNGRMSATLGGALVTSRFDERPVAPDSLLDAGVAAISSAGIAAFALLKWLITPLFTRLSKDQALEHPRRKSIFDYIQQHPGANFREVARGTNIAAGTVRHHLNVLERSELVVEHVHGSTVRLFENHGKFDHNWADMVLLREPPLAKVHEWLKAHPDSPQKAVLEAMDVDGWSRSTTQHRLARLVEGGLATIRLQGRLKIYNVAERGAPAKPAVFGPAPASSPAARPA